MTPGTAHLFGEAVVSVWREPTGQAPHRPGAGRAPAAGTAKPAELPGILLAALAPSASVWCWDQKPRSSPSAPAWPSWPSSA
jgi:hypothetical protein